MENITVSINGKNITCPPETTILEAADLHGITIPRLCHHPDLKPFGACRLCLVEDEKSGRLMASCVMPVAPEMSVLTDSPRINKHRRNIIRLMMAEHPESCIVCSKGNRCQLREIASDLGLGQTGLYRIPNYKPLEQLNPFLVRDLSKCILCGKCIRADHELVVVGAIDYNFRGFKSRPITAYDLPLEHSGCTFCGTCVTMCPTGALTVKNTLHVGTPEREEVSICGFCGVGCSLAMGVIDNQVVETNPSGSKESVNGATLCVRGHFAHDFLNAKERLTRPMIRKEGELIPAAWDEALNMTAERLGRIKKEFGPQSIGFLGSSKCTNEENYLFQKMARVLMETNNVDNGGCPAGRSVLKLINDRIGNGWRMNPLGALEKAESILVLGANPSQSVPVLSYSLKRAARKGIPLIVVDPRKTDLTSFSSVWLRISPDRDAELINCLAAMLWKQFGHDTGFIDRFTEGFSSYSEGLSSFNIERLCLEAETDMASLERAADVLKGRKIAIVAGNGILQQVNRKHAMNSVLNLSLMTGSLGCEGAGLYMVSKENNQLGAWDMGAVPDGLPGGSLLGNDSEREKWERAWNVKLSPDHGLNVLRMIEEAEKGNLKALYIMGENPLRGLPQPGRVWKALGGLDFLIVQDILETEACDIADVVLPGAAFSEKEGSFTNFEGRIQSFRPVVSPPGDAKADWEILDTLAVKMGASESHGSLGKVRTEIARIPMYEDTAVGGDVGWIKSTSQMGVFQHDGKGDSIPFSPIVQTRREAPDADYPLTALLGSLRYHLGSGTRTSYSSRIRDFGLKGEVEISPEDAQELGLQDGDTIRLSSKNGVLDREIRVDQGLGRGMIFVPVGFNGNDAMQLISPAASEGEQIEGIKICRVTMEKM